MLKKVTDKIAKMINGPSHYTVIRRNKGEKEKGYYSLTKKQAVELAVEKAKIHDLVHIEYYCEQEGRVRYLNRGSTYNEFPHNWNTKVI